MVANDAFGTGQVGNGAGNFQRAIEPAGIEFLAFPGFSWLLFGLTRLVRELV